MWEFLQTTDTHLLAIVEFSLCSLGIILTRLKKDEVFQDCLSDLIGPSEEERHPWRFEGDKCREHRNDLADLTIGARKLTLWKELNP